MGTKREREQDIKGKKERYEEKGIDRKREKSIKRKTKK